jgi:hypothetical protein
MASQNFAEFLGSLHRLTDITLEEVEDCFDGAGFTDEYCEAIVSDFKGKSEEEVRKEAMERWQKMVETPDLNMLDKVFKDLNNGVAVNPGKQYEKFVTMVDPNPRTKSEAEETLDEKLRIFNTRLRNVLNINSNIALINEGT